MEKDNKDQRKDSTQVHFEESVSWLGLQSEAWVTWVTQSQQVPEQLAAIVLPKSIGYLLYKLREERLARCGYSSFNAPYRQ